MAQSAAVWASKDRQFETQYVAALLLKPGHARCIIGCHGGFIRS
jgi:hypothetical protein